MPISGWRDHSPDISRYICRAMPTTKVWARILKRLEYQWGRFWPTSEEVEKKRGRDGHLLTAPQIRASGFPAHGSHLGYVTAKLAVRAPALVTRAPGTVSGACFAGSRSPWPPPFAPPAPLRLGPHCSSASQLLWQSLTSRDRASSATAPRLPDADRRPLPNGRSRDLPVPAQGASSRVVRLAKVVEDRQAALL
jgi:hypothetical protein